MMHRFGHPWMHGHPWSYGYGWWPEMLLSTLNTVFWIALLIGLAWALLRWLSPYIMPMIADIFGIAPADASSLEILRQRYAAGEIDAITFEQMRERLEASYQQEGNGTWTGYRDTFSSPVSREQEGMMMAEQERYTSETER